MAKNLFYKYYPLVLAASVGIFGLAQSGNAKVIPNAYIVQVAETSDVNQTAGFVAHFTRGTIRHTYFKAIRGFAIYVPPGIKKADIITQAGVIKVEPDLEISHCEQTLPTGVDRIDIDLSNAAKIDGIDERIDVDIAVIDTGERTRSCCPE